MGDGRSWNLHLLASARPACQLSNHRYCRCISRAGESGRLVCSGPGLGKSLQSSSGMGLAAAYLLPRHAGHRRREALRWSGRRWGEGQSSCPERWAAAPGGRSQAGEQTAADRQAFRLSPPSPSSSLASHSPTELDHVLPKLRFGTTAGWLCLSAHHALCITFHLSCRPGGMSATAMTKTKYYRPPCQLLESE